VFGHARPRTKDMLVTHTPLPRRPCEPGQKTGSTIGSVAAVIQLLPFDDRGREILNELEERTAQQPTEVRDDGAREYYLQAHGVGVDGFDAMLNHIDPDWPEHVSRTTQRMPRFKVPVVSDTPEQTRQALDRAGVETFGPAFSEWATSPQGRSAGPRMTPLVDAETGEAAETMVRNVVGEGCEVGPAEPIGERS
jgi:hypothetical protein